MENYFAITLKKLKTKSYKQLNIVLGNESCDLDSAVSSIVYAMFLDWQHKQIESTVCTQHCDSDKIFIAILDVKREDYPLKTEVIFCLKQHGIMEHLLIFRDDLDIKSLSSTNEVNIILVDHHVMSPQYNSLVSHVTEVIDHRPKDEKNWRFKDIRSTIDTVGSCGTLITQRIRDLSALLEKDIDFFNTYHQCTDMLYGLILLDTVNFSKNINKTTPMDVETVIFLESILKPCNIEAERQAKVDSLVKAKCDVSTLTPSQLLRKDLKTAEDIMAPTLPMLVEEFLKLPNSIQAVKETLIAMKLGLALLLGLDLVSGRRDVAIISPSDPDRGTQLAKLCQNWNSPPLQVESVQKDGCVYFKINNLSVSRKQFIPILNDFLLKYKKQ